MTFTGREQPQPEIMACSSRYQEMGLTGGVTAQPVMTDVYRIVARGNGYTGQATVQDFVTDRTRLAV